MKILYFPILFLFFVVSAFAQQDDNSFSGVSDNTLQFNNLNNHKDSLLQHLDFSDSLSLPLSAVDSLSEGYKAIADSLSSLKSSVADSLAELEQLGHKVADPLGYEVPALDNTELPGVDLPKAPLDLKDPGILDKDSVPDVGVPGNVPDLPADPDKLLASPVGGIDSKASKIDAIDEFKEQSGLADQQFKGILDQKSSVEKYGNMDQYKSLGNQKAMEKMNELFEQHGEELEAAQNQMSKLKKKYSYVPNSNDLSSAVKINSLKGEPLKKRLIIGSNFKLDKGNPLTLDFAPLVMYKFNKVFHTGLSGSYRANIKYDEKSYGSNPSSGTTNPQDVLGASALARHFVVKGFFAYSEFEYKSSAFSYDGKNWNSLSERKWVPGLLAGLGKEMSLMGKLKGTVILTYDFLHSDQSFSKSPWSIKFGFHLDDLDLKNKRKEMADSFLETVR